MQAIVPIFRRMYAIRRRPPARFRRLGLGLACLALAGSPVASWAKGPDRIAAIQLEELGMAAATAAHPQAAGAGSATVHLVGDHHLLVTFPVRKLMKRLPDGEPGDNDSTIEAVLVDIPSGKVAARTNWRLHDSGQFLWDLGHGRFLLRIRNRLTVFAPLANLAGERPFLERPLLEFENRVIVAVIVAAESDLLTVETTERPSPKPDDAKLTTVQAVRPQPKKDIAVDLNFYRLQGGNETIHAIASGRLASRIPVEIPMTADGYLDIGEEKKGRTWVFDYIAHEGRKIELAPYDTSCFPLVKFVNRSEFVAFGCHGSPDKLQIGGFNMRGEEMWQQNFYDSFVHPAFSFAPESGRFALGRSITTLAVSMLSPGVDPEADQMTGEDIQVLQMATGKQIFHLLVSPAQRLGQNFSLAADGLELALVNGKEVDVYRLPPLSPKDQQAVKAARELALEHATGNITLPSRSHAINVAAQSPTVPPPPGMPALDVKPETAASAKPPDTPAPQPEAPAPPKPVEHTVMVGDAQDDGPRKPPTLYGPGEKPK